MGLLEPVVLGLLGHSGVVVVSTLAVNAILVLSLPGRGGHVAVDAGCFGRRCSAIPIYLRSLASALRDSSLWCRRSGDLVGSRVLSAWFGAAYGVIPNPLPSSMCFSLSSDHGQDSHYLIAVAIS